MIHYEDMPQGDHVLLGPVTVSADEIVAFAQRYDPQPFHLSDAGAKDTYFGSLAASGWHTAALTMKLMMTGRDQPLAILGSPGFDNLRWQRPVYPGDELRASVTVTDRRVSKSRPEMGLVYLAVETLNENDVAVMRFDSVAMMARRDAGS